MLRWTTRVIAAGLFLGLVASWACAGRTRITQATPGPRVGAVSLMVQSRAV
jgi:hypothetical protein